MTLYKQDARTSEMSIVPFIQFPTGWDFDGLKTDKVPQIKLILYIYANYS